MSLASLKSYLLGRTMFFGLRPSATADDSDACEPALSGPAGGLQVEGVAGGTAIPVSGTVTATVDVSTLATHAKQDTLAGLVAALQAAIQALLESPTTHNAITKSDATELDDLANVGVIIGGAGDLAYRLAGAPSTTITLPVVAGQFVPGQFTRVMAATTATSIVGVAR
jgi:hypothetical protein